MNGEIVACLPRRAHEYCHPFGYTKDLQLLPARSSRRRRWHVLSRTWLSRRRSRRGSNLPRSVSDPLLRLVVFLLHFREQRGRILLRLAAFAPQAFSDIRLRRVFPSLADRTGQDEECPYERYAGSEYECRSEREAPALRKRPRPHLLYVSKEPLHAFDEATPLV